VRFVVRMRGRERAVTDRWIAQLVDLTDQLKDIGIPVGRPALEGGGVTSTVEPRKSPIVESATVEEPDDSGSEPESDS
jgi:translation initiation factor IF-3